MNNIGLSVFIYTYSFILEVLRRTVTLIFSRFPQSRRWNLRERQRAPRLYRDIRNRTVVWVHAASLGEAKLLYRFLEVLKSRHSSELYLLTAASPTGVEFLEKHRRPEVCSVGFLPIDSVPLVNRMLERFSVSRVWLVETELWPSMLWCCMQKKIPVGIVNGRIEQRSFKSLKRIGFLFRPLFESIDLVLAQDKTYAERFGVLGVEQNRIHVVGNLKGHVTVRRPDPKQWITLRKKLGVDESALLITAGCIHPGEGAVVRDCMKRLRQIGFPCRCIVVPRHMEAVPVLMEELGGEALHLRDIETDRNWDICLIEKFGILDDMYRIADAAVVGGSFVKVGGHNVWEPARFGVPVFFGPHTYSHKESCERLVSSGVGFRSQSGTALGDSIFRVMKTEASRFVNAQILFTETVNKSQAVLEPLIP
ncbi:MAG: 3-deoxy-D-manno-octulosonic acid transferase [Chitinispirillaceae bacterium]